MFKLKLLKNWYKKHIKIEKEVDAVKEHEQKFINMVIKLLETKSNEFSAMWWVKGNLDRSVKYKDIIIFEDGNFLKPIRPELSINQKEYIKKLINPIFERDSKIIIDSYLK